MKPARLGRGPNDPRWLPGEGGVKPGWPRRTVSPASAKNSWTEQTAAVNLYVPAEHIRQSALSKKGGVLCPIRRLSQVLRRRRLARGTTGKTEARYPWARSIEESSGLAAAETYPCKGNRQCREHRAGGRPWGHDSTPRPLPRSLGGEQESLAKFLPEDPTCLLGTSLGFSIGVGTTRLAASDLE